MAWKLDLNGFRDGPLPNLYGRFDVVAAKVGRYKAWFSTKTAHYNNDYVGVNYDRVRILSRSETEC
jgi:hypothetical protein